MSLCPGDMRLKRDEKPVSLLKANERWLRQPTTSALLSSDLWPLLPLVREDALALQQQVDEISQNKLVYSGLSSKVLIEAFKFNTKRNSVQ